MLKNLLTTYDLKSAAKDMAHIIITIAKNMIIYPQNYGNVDIDS